MIMPSSNTIPVYVGGTSHPFNYVVLPDDPYPSLPSPDLFASRGRTDEGDRNMCLIRCNF
ncbi:hypothetical protein E2C01_055047 [Portunus trituberculatus]|uniref:Uncharacterized protein n=1 Tax=Portunus trituberculatus TaxID=210409 RepID=A0A5B7GU92_PORTR|nr:hypothetical protein [Portunus trituberculatus]